MASPNKISVIGHRFQDLEPEREVLEPLGYVVEDLSCLSLPEVCQRAYDAAGILVGSSFRMDRNFITGLASCRGIVRYGIGFDNIDVSTAKKRSIEVRNIPDYCTEEVSTHTIAMLLALHRRLFQYSDRIKAGNWGSANNSNDIPRLSNCIAGLIGLGRIGREVARKLQVFGLQVVAYDPYFIGAEDEELGVKLMPLRDVVKIADFISLHVPLTPNTTHLLSGELLKMTQSSAYVINTSRGGLLDEKALAEALISGRLAGAALDVFETEPLPPDAPILQASNVILTPHMAWFSRAARRELQEKAAKELAGVLASHQIYKRD